MNIIKATYFPDKGVLFNNNTIDWDTDRTIIRKLLGNTYRPDDQIIDLGDTKLYMKRDIYQNYGSENNLFFFNYEDNILREVEFHGGINITIDKVQFDFDTNIQRVVELLLSISSNYTEINDGEYLFPELKLTIASDEAMGGDGNNLSYFYCSKNIDHLFDD